MFTVSLFAFYEVSCLLCLHPVLTAKNITDIVQSSSVSNIAQAVISLSGKGAFLKCLPHHRGIQSQSLH